MFNMLIYLQFVSLICGVWSQFTTPLPQSPPLATAYLGIGYNLFDGNPEGDIVNNGGLDPGYIVTSQIFQFTYNNDGVNPDQTEIVVLPTCTNTEHQDVYWGTNSYQTVLDNFVDVQGSTLMNGYQYASSQGFNEIDQSSNTQGSVYYDDRGQSYCGYGRIRTEDASAEEFPLSTNFVASVCSLPLTYNEEVYMQYLDTWGTHVVVEVTYGSRLTKRYKDERPEFVNYATQDCPGCISQGGPYSLWNDSLIVDMDMFVNNMDVNTEFGSEKSVFETGGDGDMTEPIAIQLITMAEALNLIYWQQFCTYVIDGQCVLDDLAAMASRQSFLETAIQNYASYKSITMGSDPIVQTALTWPQGAYGVPTPIDGCPLGISFNFESGWRLQDTENEGTGNQWSSPYSLLGPYSTVDMTQNFCMKTVATVTTSDWLWGPGEYCIYKTGACPAGFIPGYVLWDDEDDFPQGNDLSGTLPDGTYDRNTQIFYCCRSDGDPNIPIYLPIDVPFSLIKSTVSCQQVAGRTVREEWFLWDNENILNEDEVVGNAPYNTGGVSEHQLHYCYYF